MNVFLLKKFTSSFLRICFCKLNSGEVTQSRQIIVNDVTSQMIIKEKEVDLLGSIWLNEKCVKWGVLKWRFENNRVFKKILAR